MNLIILKLNITQLYRYVTEKDRYMICANIKLRFQGKHNKYQKHMPSKII